MALGDGTTWDESNPTDGTVGIQIDDYNRDLRKGIRLRMNNEHEWPASQSATSEAGMHKFITFQARSTQPAIAGTQIASLYVNTANSLVFQNSGNADIVITTGTALAVTPLTAGVGIVISSTNAINVSSFIGTNNSRNFTTVYQETSDGFIVGNTTRTFASHEFIAYHDSTATPITTAQLGSAVWVSGGQTISLPIGFPVRKNNYWRVVGSGVSSGNLLFIPFGT